MLLWKLNLKGNSRLPDVMSHNRALIGPSKVEAILYVKVDWWLLSHRIIKLLIWSQYAFLPILTDCALQIWYFVTGRHDICYCAYFLSYVNPITLIIDINESTCGCSCCKVWSYRNVQFGRRIALRWTWLS